MLENSPHPSSTSEVRARMKLGPFPQSEAGEPSHGSPFEMLDHTRETAEKWIARHPGASLAAALTVGILVRWLIRRR